MKFLKYIFIAQLLTISASSVADTVEGCRTNSRASLYTKSLSAGEEKILKSSISAKDFFVSIKNISKIG